ncbi:MAG: HDIG domain-containing protein [Armatimonadetes bacterium]|nr:HDIG domain-containing protein [Armatimonadota bacterium]
MTRPEALELLHEFTQSESLRKHAYAVEAAMRAYARKLGEDEELWGVVGLLHDFDYERYPTLGDHPFKGAEILRERGVDEEIVQACLSHYSESGIPRDTRLKRAIFAVDELAGFIIAVALVRPSKQLADVEVKSVKKKMKDKAFAAAVSREDIEQGAAAMGVSLEEHIGTVLEGMKGEAEALGL